MNSIRRSLALSFASKYSAITISIISVIIIARLLTPAEIGLYSIAAVVASLSHALRDFGVGNYLIQEKEFTTENIRSALGISILISWGMGLLLYLSSNLLSDFYGESDLEKILVILSATFIFVPFSAPVIAILRRKMAFHHLYVVGITNAVVHATTAVALAALEFGSISLAWASLAAVLVTTLTTAYFRPNDVPLLPSFKNMRRVAHFGGAASIAAILTQIGGGAIDLIVGRTIGFTAVGLYSRANGLVSLFHRDFMAAILNVALPAFATEHRENRDLRSPYLKSISIVTLFAWPFYGFLGLMAEPIIRILFGAQWDAAVPLAQLLALAMAISALWSLAGQVLIASGNIYKLLYAELIIQSFRILLIILLVPFGLKAIAASQIVFAILGLFVYNWHLSKVVQVSLQDIVDAALPSLKVTFFSLIAPAVLVIFMDLNSQTFVILFVLAVIGTGIGWMTSLMLSDHAGKIEVLNAIKYIARRWI